MYDIIIGIEESDTWDIQLTIAIYFIFSKGAEEESVMHWKSNNEEFMINDNANDIADKLSKPPLLRYENNLEISMRGSDFIFDSVQCLF